MTLEDAAQGKEYAGMLQAGRRVRVEISCCAFSPSLI